MDPLDSLEESAHSAEAKEPPPLDRVQRLALQNLFDTQPKRREAYLKKLGYEMNPKDDNEYRPVGSDGSWGEIDHGFIKEFKKGWVSNQGKGVLSQLGGGVKNVASEAEKDVEDIGYDASISGPAVAAGISAGTAASAPLAAASGAGAPVIAGIGAVLGGAIGNAAAEKVKQFAGDLLLDEHIPVENGPLIVQSLMTSVAPMMLKGGKRLAKEGWDVFLRARRDAIVNAAKQSGGGLTEEILNKAIKSPEMFTKEAVDGANTRLTDQYKVLFGLEDPLRIKAPDQLKGNSLFGKTMAPLHAQANSEIARLSEEPAGNFSAQELNGPLISKLDELTNKFRRTPEEDQAISFLKKEIADINKKGDKGPINFKDARDYLSSVQKEISQKDAMGNFLHPAGNVLAPAFGGGEDGLLNIINSRAEQLGSKLPQINAQRARVYQAYQTASKELTPQVMTSAFIGDDKPKKQLVQGVFGELDNVLGTNLSQRVEDGQMQAAIENMYKNPKGFASGRVNAEMVKEGIKQGMVGMAGGTAIGAPAGVPGMIAGGTLGAIGGAAKGAHHASMMASPERALEALGKTAGQITSSEASLAKPTETSYIEQLASQLAGRRAGEAISPKPSPSPVKSSSTDPLNAIDPLDNL